MLPYVYVCMYKSNTNVLEQTTQESKKKSEKKKHFIIYLCELQSERVSKSKRKNSEKSRPVEIFRVIADKLCSVCVFFWFSLWTRNELRALMQSASLAVIRVIILQAHIESVYSYWL